MILLKHTNILLTGQQKLNLYLSVAQNGFEVTKVQFVPVNEALSSPSVKNVDENLFTSPTDKLSELYNFSPNNFWQCDADTLLYKNYTEAGIKRISYQRYGTQIAIFCPVWINSKSDFFDKSFYFSKKELNSINDLQARKIVFPQKVKTWLKKYIDNISEFPIYCNTKTNEFLLNGFSVSDGAFCQRTDKNVLDIFKKEYQYVLQKQNEELTLTWKRSGIICPNLLNLNFIFPDDDLLSYQQTTLSDGDIVSGRISVIDSIGDFVPIKDIFVNHSEIIIGGKNIIEKSSEQLSQAECNHYKINQEPIHWSSSKSSPIFFNNYTDFSDGSFLPNASDFSGHKDIDVTNSFCAFTLSDTDQIANFESHMSSQANMMSYYGGLDADLPYETWVSDISTDISASYCFGYNRINNFIENASLGCIYYPTTDTTDMPRVHSVKNLLSTDKDRTYYFIVLPVISSVFSSFPALKYTEFASYLDANCTDYPPEVSAFINVMIHNSNYTKFNIKHRQAAVPSIDSNGVVSYNFSFDDIHTRQIYRTDNTNLYPFFVPAPADKENVYYNVCFVPKSGENGTLIQKGYNANLPFDNQYYLLEQKTESEYLQWCSDNYSEYPGLGTAGKMIYKAHSFEISVDSESVPLSTDLLNTYKKDGYTLTVEKMSCEISDTEILYKYTLKNTLE